LSDADNPIEKLRWRLKDFITANRRCRSMEDLLAVADKFFKQLTPDNNNFFSNALGATKPRRLRN